LGELQGGERIGGRYVLLRRLGLGGMGEVWLAVQEGAGVFRRRVVIKLLSPERRDDDRIARMLADEARVVGLLHHPGIVAAIDYLETPGDGPVFVLEYVDGTSLRTALRSARRRNEIMPEVLAVHVGACVARALHAAHTALDGEGRALRIVHRDVAPDNVLLSRSGAVYLGDFGVARAAGNSDVTQPGTTPKGKRGYMPPEQALGADVGPSADVFSLGRVIAEAADLLCSPGLRQVLDRATADDPLQRFQTAAEFAAALVSVCPPPPDPDGALSGWLSRVAPEAMGVRETSPGATPHEVVTPQGPRRVQLQSDPPAAAKGEPAGPQIAPAGSPEESLARRSLGQLSFLRIVAAVGVLLALLSPVAAVYALGQGRFKQKAEGVRAASGEVRVRSQPDGAEVFIDGALRGITPLQIELPVGRHALRVGSARLERWRASEFVVRDNVRHELEVDLTQ